MQKNECGIKAKALEKPSITNIKQVLFAHAISYIDKLLAKGEFCAVSDVVEFALSLLEDGEVLTSTFQTRDMKQLMLNHYRKLVTISPKSE